jgi:hypothetical protein
VVLAELEAETEQGADALATKMNDCLKQAAKELEDPDYRLVEHAWLELQTRIVS